MAGEDATPPYGPVRPDPATFLAAAAALRDIEAALREAGSGGSDAGQGVGREEALASLLLLREVRERLAGWEPGLIETARAAGASWADLAAPLGVASRQAAERRYLRLRPGADRSVSAWARDNAGELRLLAGEIAALTDLPPAARPSLGDLRDALAHDDASRLVAPLAATAPHLAPAHPALAARVDTLTRRTDALRTSTTSRRRTS
jgi:hypothetical protein